MSAMEFFISPEGSDANSGLQAEPGTPDGPFRTLERARDAVRSWRAEGGDGTVFVTLRGGRYELDCPFVLTPDDSGTPDAPVVYRAYAGEQPTLSGARRIEGWDVEELGEWKRWKVTVPGLWRLTQLFVNGHRCKRSRLPAGDDCFTLVDEHTQDRADRFGVRSGDIDPPWKLAGAEMILPLSWRESHLQVKGFDARSGVLSTEAPALIVFGQNELNAAKYWLENIFEGLADSGQFHVDYDDDVIYYIPQFLETPEESVVYAPHLVSLVEFRGEVQGQRVTDIRFEGITFCHTEWSYPADTGGAFQAAFTIPGALTFTAAQRCVLYNCTIRQVATYAVEFGLDCTDNAVIACSLHDLGGGGVKVVNELGRATPTHDHRTNPTDAYWRDRMTPPAGTDLSAMPRQKVTVSDCVVRDFGKIFLSAIGVLVGDAAGCRIRHNEIHHGNYSGISLGWTWLYNYDTRAGDNRVEYNHIHDINTGRILSDIGGIYTLGPQPGTQLRGNVIHGIHRAAYGNWGIYHDNGSSFILAEDNILYDCSYGAYHINDARDLIARNNLILLQNDPSGTPLNWSKDAGFRTLTASGNVIVGHAPQVFGWGSFNGHVRFARNTYWGDFGDVSLAVLGPNRLTVAEWMERGFGRDELAADPLLIDGRNGWPTLRSDSPAITKQGFKPLELSRVGPRWNTELPLRFVDWPHALPEAPEPVVMAVLMVDNACKPMEDPEASPLLATSPRDFIVVDSASPTSGTLRLVNRGEVVAKGRMKLTLEPSDAGQLDLENVDFHLQPGQEVTHSFAVKIKAGAKYVLLDASPIEGDSPLPVGLFLHEGAAPPLLAEKKFAPGQWN